MKNIDASSFLEKLNNMKNSNMLNYEIVPEGKLGDGQTVTIFIYSKSTETVVLTYDSRMESNYSIHPITLYSADKKLEIINLNFNNVNKNEAIENILPYRHNP